MTSSGEARAEDAKSPAQGIKGEAGGQVFTWPEFRQNSGGKTSWINYQYFRCR